MTLRARGLIACLSAFLAITALAASYSAACSYFPDSTTLQGGGNPSAPYIDGCYTEFPVNCATGNQTEEETDLVLGGRGPGLHVTRTYNSQAAAEAKSSGAGGYGWSGPYSSHLEFNKESGAVTVVQENGSTAAFALESGKYVAGAWIQATLVKEGESFYVFTLPTQEKLKFNSEGRLIEQKDRNGNALTIVQVSGLISTVKDAAGRELKFAYTEGHVTSIEDPMGNKVKYAYESGNLSSVTLPGEETPRWKFKYDASHQLIEMTDGRGGVVKTAYDEKHRVKEQTDPMSRITKFAYAESEGNRTTTITEPNGSTTFEKFNDAGEPLEVIKAKGTTLEQKTTSEYNEAYERIKTTDALGHSTFYKYTSAGDLVTETDSESNVTSWTYNTTHDVLSETTPKGEKTTYIRDSRGNVEAIERPAPGETVQKATFKHALNGDLESATDPLGHETKFEYDTYGDLKAETDAVSDKTTWTYNKDGKQLTEVSPRGNEEGAIASEFETKTERDAQGRPIKVTDPLGHETKSAYDKNGNLESKTDALGHATKYTYDADDEQIKVEKANGSVTGATYDSMGEPASRTDGNGDITKYVHNALEQLTETIDPLERKAKREYDAAGNLKKTEDALGRTVSYSYDAANRLKEVNYSEEATHDVTFKYDKDGNVIEMVDGTGTTTEVYDQLDRLTELTNGAKEVVKYKFDLANGVTELTYPNGKTIKRAFDKAGRLEKITDWFGNETAFAYNRDSRLKTTSFPTATGDLDESTYNRIDQLTGTSMKKGSEVLASLSYTRSKIGQVESLVQKGLPGGESFTYEYDVANRLVKGAGIPYEYDAANNITKKNTVTYTYDKAGQIATASNATFEYNKLGQRIKRDPTGEAATTYAYDQAGNLLSVQRPVEGEAAKIDETYKSDGTGLRVSESVEGIAHPMVWDVSSELPLLLTNGSTKWIYGPEGFPVEQINPSEEVRFLHHDQQGSTRLITNSAGNVVGAYHYGPYGTIESFTGTVTTPLGFGGQYRSSQSGLIYMRARVYDFITGQFLSVDPIVGQTGEPYSYAADNPVNAADPTGLCVGDPECPKCPPVRPDATNTRMTSRPRERLPVPPNTNTIGPKYGDSYLFNSGLTRFGVPIQDQSRVSPGMALFRVGVAAGAGALLGGPAGMITNAGWEAVSVIAEQKGYPLVGDAINVFTAPKTLYGAGPTLERKIIEIGPSLRPSTYIPPSLIPPLKNGSLYIP